MCERERERDVGKEGERGLYVMCALTCFQQSLSFGFPEWPVCF